MKVGKEVRGDYSFPFSEWEATKNYPTFNPNWNRLELIKRLTTFLDEGSGGICQAERIRNSQIIAIQNVVEKYAKENIKD